MIHAADNSFDSFHVFIEQVSEVYSYDHFNEIPYKCQSFCFI